MHMTSAQSSIFRLILNLYPYWPLIPCKEMRNYEISELSINTSYSTSGMLCRKQMGWDFKWVSSYGTDFNFDYHVFIHTGRIGQERSLLQHRRSSRFRASRSQRIL